MKKSLLFRSILFLLAAFLVSACAMHSHTIPSDPCAVSGNNTRAQMLCALRRSHVKGIIHGDTLIFILPADRFFREASDQFCNDQLMVLTDISKIIHAYHSRRVQVFGYGDDVGSDDFQKTLSTRRAKNVAAFLWAQGIEHERLHVIGWGKRHPISSNRTLQGSADNRRVEIHIHTGPEKEPYGRIK